MADGRHLENRKTDMYWQGLNHDGNGLIDLSRKFGTVTHHAYDPENSVGRLNVPFLTRDAAMLARSWES